MKMHRKLSVSQQKLSRYNNNCSVKGATQNFIKIKKDAAIQKPISTGSAIGNWVLTKIPVIGKGVKYINIGSTLGAYTAHGINAYRESKSEAKRS